MRTFSLLSLILALAFAGCKTQQKTAGPEPEKTVEIVEERQLDTLFVTPPKMPEEESVRYETEEDYTLPVYRATQTLEHDLLHTRLDLRFDWENEKVLGEAALTLTPYFYPTQTLTLDAKNFEFHQVSLAGQTAQLPYEYDGNTITIDLGQTFRKGETFELFIDYTASPTQTGGSSAITSDKGLFFINPRNEEPDKPRQIWTQGETEWNSRWFPTIDQPNERTTQELYLTVEDRFTTLSNGLLISSEKNEDGTRTDYWKMDQPHAPYLFMIAIGEYAVVRDEWRGIPVDYYVEPEYEADARAIFSNTTEMLSFFSDKLGIPYPWKKYAQVVVRDYVSGAMENTTAVIYGEFVQRHRRELIDDHNERIIAHELSHHWFGDLVTCESWANLTMNEGFANYSEYLWMEHQYGRDEADYHLLGEWSGYVGAAQNTVHPLIHFSYFSKEDMFDAHSYNKGGSVLHMLRYYVGDEAFWAGLRHYLEENTYRAVEAHDLRLAFEAVTGQDLNWFFNQWFFDQGHPVLDIEYGFDESTSEALVTVTQTQDADIAPPIFILPVAIDVYEAGGQAPTRHEVRVDQREQTFRFPVEKEPELILFDAERITLCERQENKTNDQLAFQFFNAPRFLDRYEALVELRETDLPEADKVLTAALDDPHWVIRAIGAEDLEAELGEAVVEKLRNLAVSDPNSNVRYIALEKLAEFEDEQLADLARRIIERDSAYQVQAAALYMLYEQEAEDAVDYAERLRNEPSEQLLEVVSLVFESSGDPQYLPFLEERVSRQSGFGVVGAVARYQALAAAAGAPHRLEAMEKLAELAGRPNQNPMLKLASARAIHDTIQSLEQELPEDETASGYEQLNKELDILRNMLQNIKDNEKDEDIRRFYDQF